MHSSSTRPVLALAVASLLLGAVAAQAGKYDDTIDVFKHAGESEGGFISGAALGKGQVYEQGHLVGNATMKQLSGGFQAGGKVYSQIVFFKDKRSLEAFESGNFEFQAGASAVAITADASATASTGGLSSSASLTDNDSNNVGAWHNGMAVFTVAKGGLMYAATIAGQKFEYKERGTG